MSAVPVGPFRWFPTEKDVECKMPEMILKVFYLCRLFLVFNHMMVAVAMV